ncbi:MAG: hypothetical protein N4A45_12790 [Flavobacteriales bacterium]|nr:hypothetical protein [Flavobacteriales bacterium]
MIIESNKNYTLSIYQKTNKIFQIESFIYFDNEAIKKEYSFFLNKEFSSVDSIGLSINYKKIKIDSVTIYNSKNEILFSEILENNHFVLARSLLENEITHNWELEAHHFINNTAIESYPMVLDTQMTCVDISKEIAELRNLIMINESGFDWNNLDSIKCDNTANDPESI